jgi:hypothetical protein
MSNGFTKLYGSIIHSTIWREDDKTRIVWITMLALADESGNVMASVPGLADAARVSIAECEAALQKLSSPDKYSRSKEQEGRRIVEIDGGWHIINRNKYRDKQSDRAEYWKNYKRKKRAKMSTVESVESVDKCGKSTQTETETEVKKDAETAKSKRTPCNVNIKRNEGEEKTKKKSLKNFVSASIKTKEGFTLKICDLFAIDPRTSNHTAIVNLALQLADSDDTSAFDKVFRTAKEIIDRPTTRCALAVFFDVMKRDYGFIGQDEVVL